MSTRKSTAELLANAEEASRKARTRVSELKKRHVEEQRKKRTKRLIETGAIIEKVFEMEFDTEDKRKRLLTVLTKSRQYGNGTTCTFEQIIKKELESNY